MNNWSALEREIDGLKALQAELAKISERRDDQRRHDLVRLRRDLSVQIGRVGQVADPLIEAMNDSECLQEYRAKFSRMRSMAAIHQAEWPAVRLTLEVSEEYRASALRVRAANHDFHAWIDAMVAKHRQRL